MAVRIVVAGEIYVDQILTGFSSFPQPGEEVYATDFTREAGGGAALTAVGLMRLGWDATLVASVGNDTWLPARLEQLGLNTSGLRRNANLPAGTTVVVSTPQERTFFTYRGANADLEDGLRSVPPSRHLHVAAPCNPETLLRLATASESISIDAGWIREWLTDPKVHAALRKVSWFFPNEIEARALTGETDPSDILRRCDEMGIRVAVKLGRSGSSALVDGQFIFVPSILVEAVDTTGAGDCFDAGFLDAWLRGEPIPDCLRAGNICGALSTRFVGGINGFPKREELNRWRSKSL
jgi:sugar/nucleoside kinase (ribokinase family)